MAPHDTNTRREARRHWFPLAGMAVVVALVALGFLWWVAGASGLIGEGEPVPEGGLLQEEAVETNEPPPPADVPPADVPPAEVPPAEVPPADVPPADVPPAEVPPVETPPADVPPVEVPPAEAPPADEPPAEAPAPAQPQ